MSGDKNDGTDYPTFGEVVARRLSRRAAMTGALAAASAASFGTGPLGQAAEAADAPRSRSSLRFTEIAKGQPESHQIPKGYRVQVVARWGDKVAKDAPAFDPRRQTAAAQLKQFGTGCDYIAYMPLPRGSGSSERGILCINHERNESHMMFPGMTRRDFAQKMTKELADVEMAAIGHSLVEVRRSGRSWRVVEDSPYNRRITALDGRVRISGPAAGHARMQTKAFPTGRESVGIMINCAGGTTPWGTVLTPCEGFNSCFTGNPDTDPAESANHKRYGINGRGRYVWGRFDDRFNLDKEPRFPNHQGWITEIDPYDPKSLPVKRTALGRGKFECANTVVNPDGRVVVYLGDDEAFEYVYKFVTRGRYVPGNRSGNRDLLDEGTLYVARFEADGRLAWLPLVHGQGPLTAANGFRDQGEVLIDTRRAADAVGATKLDRPEDVEVNPRTGKVYMALTKNAARKPEQTDAVNSRANNVAGHIVEMVPPALRRGVDHAATAFRWEFFALCGNPKVAAHGARYLGELTENGWLACPDNFAFDPRGRLWITTDGADDLDKISDSLYAADTEGPGRGQIKLFFNCPDGGEPTGPCFTPDGRTLFLSIQHPGDGPESTFDNPTTRWPDFKPDMPAREAVIAITKDDGGPIGS